MSVDSYKTLEKIGEGTYGIVYRALSKQTKKIVALKKIRNEKIEDGINATTLREISILKNLNFSRIIPILNVIIDNDDIFVVYEYLETDLKKFIDSKKHFNFNENLKKKMAKQIIEGVAYLHKNGIMHRDLKPQNILLDKNNNIKIADFGLGRRMRLPLRTLTKEIITLWYRPPELLLGVKKYSSSVDIWSLGCIIAEISNLEPLFPGDSEIDQLFKIFTILGTPNEKTWQNFSTLENYSKSFPVYKPLNLNKFIKNEFLCTLVKFFLIYDPLKRCTAVDALEKMREFEC